MKAKMLFFIAIALLLTTASIAMEFDGYIFKTTQETAMLLSEDSSVTPLDFGTNLFTAESEDDIYSFIDKQYIEYVEPNYIAELSEVPNDTYYTTQWYLQTLGMESVWDEFTELDDVTIAVIDSGIMTGHEDFDYDSRIITGYNTIAKSTDTDDDIGHGTFIAGIISAIRGNGIGVAGITNNAKIIPIKAFNANNGSVTNICEAIYRAVDVYNCDIINMSFGFRGVSPSAFKEAIEYANQKGVIMIASVGNDGSKSGVTDTPLVIQYPAGYDCVIGVGSVGSTDERSYFSQYNSSVFVTAPGESITGISHVPSPDGIYYKIGGGTSYASPVVASIVAVAKGIDRTITTQRIKKLLLTTSVDLGDDGYDIYYGHGRMDAQAFFERMTTPLITFPSGITVTSGNTSITDGSFIQAGTKVVVSCALPDYLDPVIYFNGTQITNGEQMTIPYEDVEITLEYNSLRLDIQSDSSISVGGYHYLDCASKPITVIISVYDTNGRMFFASSSELQSDEKGYILIPNTSIPSGETCKLFFFTDLSTLKLTKHNNEKVFDLTA